MSNIPENRAPITFYESMLGLEATAAARQALLATRTAPKSVLPSNDSRQAGNSNLETQSVPTESRINAETHCNNITSSTRHVTKPAR